MEKTHHRNALSGRVLLSGGAGFLGSWLAEALNERGLKITCVDNLSTGLHSNLRTLRKSIGFKFVKERVEDYHPKGKFDYILHFASRPTPGDYMARPIETLTPNSKGVMNMLEEARKSDALFFLASTSEVYGDAQKIPTPEDYWGYVNPVGLRSCYDEGKRFAEALAVAYQRRHGLDVRIMRIFNVYGPRMRSDGIYGRVISIFIKKALANEPIPIHGDGSQTRSFAYITDWLEAALLLLSTKEAKHEVINVGGDKETRIIDLARLIITLTASQSTLVYKPQRTDDPHRRRPDISKAKHILGWSPKTSLEKGLLELIDWMKMQQYG